MFQEAIDKLVWAEAELNSVGSAFFDYASEQDVHISLGERLDEDHASIKDCSFICARYNSETKELELWYKHNKIEYWLTISDSKAGDMNSLISELNDKYRESFNRILAKNKELKDRRYKEYLKLKQEFEDNSNEQIA